MNNKPNDHCVGIICGDNASCMTAGKSFDCICNEGYIKNNNSPDSAGGVLNKL